jgi:hypothetical protein
MSTVALAPEVSREYRKALQAAQHGDEAAVDFVNSTIDQQERLELWLEQGRQIAMDGAGYHWRIGDWLCSAKELDEKLAYREAEIVTGIRRKMLYDLAWVASNVPISVRTEKLSWNHHRQVAHLEPSEQQYWLGKAETEGLAVSQLRELTKEPRQQKPKQGQKQKPQRIPVELTSAQEDLVRIYATRAGISAAAYLQKIFVDWYEKAALTVGPITAAARGEAVIQ